MLAASEAELVERIAVLTLERDAYRDLAQLAVHKLHGGQEELRRLREQHHRLIDEYRALRAELLQAA